MSDPAPPPPFPSWLGAAVLTLLTLQLGLIWIQGGLLHRQHRELQDLREDVQYLSDALDQNLLQDSGTDTEVAPTHTRLRRLPSRLLRVRHLQEPSDDERARKEQEASRESARKAVSDAREVQSKLSIEENSRKVEEASKVQAATHSWQRWTWGAFGLVILALVARTVIRRRA